LLGHVRPRKPGRLVNNYAGNSDAWVDGRADISAPPAWTNVDVIKRGLLWKYNDSLAIYRCPTDGVWPQDGPVAKHVHRVRSFSLSGRMNSDAVWVNGEAWPPHVKYTSIRQPSPAQSFVFIDENPWTIDDGLFSVKAFENVWHNAPAVRHSYGATLSFADGHSELWKWLEPTTGKIRTWNATTTAKDRDLLRVKSAFLVKDQ
jgi:prepilin-type processing-associated H-X9-DG protein